MLSSTTRIRADAANNVIPPNFRAVQVLCEFLSRHSLKIASRLSSDRRSEHGYGVQRLSGHTAGYIVDRQAGGGFAFDT